MNTTLKSEEKSVIDGINPSAEMQAQLKEMLAAAKDVDSIQAGVSDSNLQDLIPPTIVMWEKATCC